MRGRRARVLLLTFEYGPIRCGGLATIVTTLCGALDQERFEPVLVLPRSGHTPPWRLVERRSLPYGEAELYREHGCEIWLLSSPLLDSEIYPEPANYTGIKKIDEYCERVAELLAVLDVDLVHLHDAFGYKCLALARWLGLPSVLTIHRLHDDEPPFFAAELAAVRLVDELTTVSRSYLQERQDVFRARGHVHVIPNGMELGFWSAENLEPVPGGRPERMRQLQQRLGLPPGPVFAYVGRLDSVQKGLDVLLDAMARRPLNLVIAGDGEPALAARIAAASRACPQGNVRFLHRMLSRDEVRDVLGAVDFVVIPSIFEPFGLIQLEAMAMGALPVASRVGGLKDVIIDLREDGFGRLFDAGDPDSLAAAMQEMAELAQARPEVLARARLAAREHAMAYSARAMAEPYERLYTSLLERGAQADLRRAS